MEKIQIINILKRGGAGVLPTDTLYGIVGRTLSLEVVERIYHIKKRSPEKPPIILISSITDLRFFGVEENPLVGKFWPGKVSIVLSCKNPEWEYLHRGTQTLAFRLPDSPELLEILKETGPLIAPSANPEGQPPAENIAEARAYFGESVDFYQDGGVVRSSPSTIISLQNGTVQVLRKGAVEISDFS